MVMVDVAEVKDRTSKRSGRDASEHEICWFNISFYSSYTVINENEHKNRETKTNPNTKLICPLPPLISDGGMQTRHST